MTSSDSCAEPLFDLPETSLTLYADSMESALVRLGATVLVILGHTGCGAMEVACSGEQMASPDLTAIVHRIRPEGGATPPEAVLTRGEITWLDKVRDLADYLPASAQRGGSNTETPFSGHFYRPPPSRNAQLSDKQCDAQIDRETVFSCPQPSTFVPSHQFFDCNVARPSSASTTNRFRLLKRGALL